MINLLNPSILSANFSNLERDLKKLKENDIKKIHLDVMDGNFVPNITFGPDQIKCLREISDFYFDSHLMVDEPIRFVDSFVNAGVNCLTIHVEACKHVHRSLEYIKSKNIHCGIALNPSTSISTLENILDIVDKILIMTVNPGFGGQKFIDSMTYKIQDLKELLYKKNLKDKVIQVDGGINDNTIKTVYDLGVTDIVVGSYIFSGNNIDENIKKLINKIR